MNKRTLVIAFIAFAVLGCSSFFAAAYDPHVHRGVEDLQTKLDGHFDKLQNGAGVAGDVWQHTRGFYDSVRADIDTLRFYAALQRGNDPTLQSLDLLLQNIDKVEEMHRDGFTPREIPIVRSVIDIQLRLLRQLEQAKKRRREAS